MSSENHSPPANPGVESATKKILEALRGLRFGSVEITVHDSRIVQIERKEKVRLNIVCPNGGEEVA